ncbi:MAG: mannose-6-phosphate isomerase, class I [Lactobacillaceae bacterium]|nr:mannose-6-phosphate isomerase, class I [Lactobacillaceae bacterium]
MAQPLFLNSVFKEKIWGGNHLKKFGYSLPSNNVGEYWAISAHPNGLSVIKNGAFKGQTLDNVYKNHRELFNNSQAKKFPLLTKILDANQWLSVQVHPNDAYALKQEGELGKTECWYIISADENSEIIYGHNARNKKELIKMINDNEWDKLLRKIKVKAGDFYYVPSGTMHVIGKGIMILETQQSSDSTYRIYDFNRKDQNGNLRKLDIEKAIDVLTFGIPKKQLPKITKTNNLIRTSFISNDVFSVDKLSISGPVKLIQQDTYSLCSVIDGEGALSIDNTNYKLSKGDHYILTSDIKEWALDGNLMLITSTPSE